MKTIKMIAAVDAKRGLARQGVTPWDLPGDRNHLSELTAGGVVIMGRKTHEAVGSRQLGARNIVLSRDSDFIPREGSEVMHSLEEALAIDADVLWVIGGEDVYRGAIDQTEVIHLTKVDGDYGCDRFFPPYETEFVLTNTSLPRYENNITYVHATYTRK